MEDAKLLAVMLSIAGSIYLLIIGAYIWSFRNFGKIYEVVHNHKENADIHGDNKNFVASNVCTALHGALKEDVTEIKKDVKCILSKL